jgi:uncharacterized protein with von Willebrand factor type A (vWA) domain
VAVGEKPLKSRGRLGDNVMQFTRFLRAAGIPVGPGKALDATESLACVDIANRDDFYWTLRAVLVNRREHLELFDQAFHMFWKDPFALNQALSLLLPSSTVNKEVEDDPVLRRLSEAAQPKPKDDPEEEPEEQEQLEFDSVMTASLNEQLKAIDFEQMSAREIERAKRAIARMRMTSLQIPTRRLEPHPRGRRVDPRKTMRASLRTGGQDIPLQFRRPKKRPPPLVVLCDISGSMERYSRLLLHFIHALSNARQRVHSFVFGTRLTNITRTMKYRDVDDALGKVGREVADWGGGTRIGDALREFNRRWGRRVLGQGAVVLLVTDGLERDDPFVLGAEAERLSKSCRRLVWLNPLLRFDGFEPLAAGMQAMLPWVDELRQVHNLASLEQLCGALGEEWHTKARDLGRPAWTPRPTLEA